MDAGWARHLKAAPAPSNWEYEALKHWWGGHSGTINGIMFKLAALMRIFHWYLIWMRIFHSVSSLEHWWGYSIDILLIWWANHGGIGLLTARAIRKIPWNFPWIIQALMFTTHFKRLQLVTSMDWPKTPLHRSGGLPSWSFLIIFRPRTQLVPNHRNVKHLGVLGISMCWISLKSVIDSLAWIRFCICRLWSFSRIALVQCGSLMSRKG